MASKTCNHKSLIRKQLGITNEDPLRFGQEVRIGIDDEGNANRLMPVTHPGQKPIGFAVDSVSIRFRVAINMLEELRELHPASLYECREQVREIYEKYLLMLDSHAIIDAEMDMLYLDLSRINRNTDEDESHLSLLLINIMIAYLYGLNAKQLSNGDYATIQLIL